MYVIQESLNLLVLQKYFSPIGIRKDYAHVSSAVSRKDCMAVST